MKINLYICEYTITGIMGYGKGVAVVSAKSENDAIQTLKTQGEYNGFINAYNISIVDNVASSDNYAVSTILKEVNVLL